jgi:hypothetical protein
MFKVLLADKDSYITNRFIRSANTSSIKTNSNVGAASTLDLFKLYGSTFDASGNPRKELSRILIHFDLQPLKDLIAQDKINVNHSSFNCKLQLFDVYGGQTTPSNFNVSAYPLSRSFDEGEGRDIVYYSDIDYCNFLTSSFSSGSWLATGCSLAGYAESNCDYITSSNGLSINSFESKQFFSSGEENLELDVTTIISATLAGALPDSGFRISFSQNEENNAYSYFVKRFASRTAYNSSKHPRIIMRYNDSIIDDSRILRFDTTSTMFLRNYRDDRFSNILSGSSLSQVTGSNCLLLKLKTTRSDGSGSYTVYVTGSQHYDGLNYFDGLYSASFMLPQSDAVLYSELTKSGSILFTPVWSSLDGTVDYYTAPDVYAYPPNRSSAILDGKEYVITTSGIQTLHRSSEDVIVRLDIFDYTSPFVKLVKNPINLPGIVLKRAHYQVRDVSTNEIIIPFDETYDSTRISSDTEGMYFTLDMSSLPLNRSYVVDVMINVIGHKKIYKAVSNVFNVSNSQIF